jgi:hypothetical protein
MLKYQPNASAINKLEPSTFRKDLEKKNSIPLFTKKYLIEFDIMTSQREEKVLISQSQNSGASALQNPLVKGLQL